MVKWDVTMVVMMMMMMTMMMMIRMMKRKRRIKMRMKNSFWVAKLETYACLMQLTLVDFTYWKFLTLTWHLLVVSEAKEKDEIPNSNGTSTATQNGSTPQQQQQQQQQQQLQHMEEDASPIQPPKQPPTSHSTASDTLHTDTAKTSTITTEAQVSTTPTTTENKPIGTLAFYKFGVDRIELIQ